MSALRGLLRKEIVHIRRDPRTLTVLIALPIVQVVLFGYAIRTDVTNVRLAIVDPMPDHATLDLRSRFAAAGVFRIVAVVPRTENLEPLFQTGAAQQAIVFESDFGNHLENTPSARLQVITDATDPNTGALLDAYASSVIDVWQRELASRDVVSAARRTRGNRVVIVPQTRMRFNPTRESSNLFVPGLMAFVLTIISSLMTAISLTREKETGTMESLLVSPLKPWQIIVGKVAPYLVIGFISVVTILLEALLLFRVPLRGKVLLLLAEGGLFILTSLSLGILVSARTSSQRVAMIGALAGTLLPNVLLSGFIFPVESMPAPLQVIAFVIPGRWFVEIARGIMLKGIGLGYLWQATLILGVTTLLLLVASTRSFKTRLE
jgi:ABC-2 type transport system permease protein